MFEMNHNFLRIQNIFGKLSDWLGVYIVGKAYFHVTKKELVIQKTKSQDREAEIRYFLYEHLSYTDEKIISVQNSLIRIFARIAHFWNFFAAR